MKLLTLVFALLLLASPIFATPVQQETALVAATWAAESVWGPVNLLESEILLKPDGQPAAYSFVFGINGVTYLNESIILEGYNLRQAGFIDEGWQVARDPDSYAYTIISVDDQYGPILEMCDGLPAHKIFREDVRDMGEELFDQRVTIEEMYYIFPLDNWFRVSTANASAIVNPRRQITIEVTEFESFDCIYDLSGSPSASYYWELTTSTPSPVTDDEGYIADVPNFNQEDTDCGPHSAAQTVGYWDDHTYLGYGPWDLLIDTDFWGLRDEMRSAMGWVPGGGVTDPEIRDGIITVCNDPLYNNNYAFDAILYSDPVYANCTDAVDAGRPGEITTWNHPIYGSHAMTFVGYNDTPTEMVQVHDNWPPSSDEPWIDFDATIDGIIDVFPGGGVVTPITLASFTGEFEDGCVVITWITACEIDCYGYNVLRGSEDDLIQVNSEIILASGGSCETAYYRFEDDNIAAGGTYTYALETIFEDGRSEVSATVSVRTLKHALSQNIPNPFNPVTTIRYEVPETGFVKLAVYDLTGRMVANLVDELREANTYSAVFDASGLASGIYFYKLEAGNFTSVRKMALMK